MAKHHPDLIMCRKQPGIAIGRLCEKCDGKCVVCDSYVRPCTRAAASPGSQETPGDMPASTRVEEELPRSVRLGVVRTHAAEIGFGPSDGTPI